MGTEVVGAFILWVIHSALCYFLFYHSFFPKQIFSLTISSNRETYKPFSTASSYLTLCVYQVNKPLECRRTAKKLKEEFMR